MLYLERSPDCRRLGAERALGWPALQGLDHVSEDRIAWSSQRAHPSQRCLLEQAFDCPH